MLSATLSTALHQHGLSDDEALRKRLLFDLVLGAFAERSTQPLTHALWVPGRIEIFGKHTDYAGGQSLVAPVPRGFAVLASPRADGVVAMHDASRREQFVVHATALQNGDGPDDAVRGWRRYALTAVRRLARNFPGAALGADIVFASDLPPASGMSSSSALIVAIAASLIRLAHLEQRPEWQAAPVVGDTGVAGYYACIENGVSFGELSGDGGVGTHGGSEDHVAIVCGRAGHAAAWGFVPIAPVATVRIPEPWTFVIASSGVAARKTGEARDAYNKLSADARALLELWNRDETPQLSVRAAVASAPDAPERLQRMIAAQPGATAADLEARLAHFMGENPRVMEAVHALATSDAPLLGALSQASQDDAERLLRNQLPETVSLVRQAREMGALAASSFGAGFGGSVWALVRKPDAPGFSARWLSSYRAQFPARDAATVFEAPPGPPLTWLE